MEIRELETKEQLDLVMDIWLEENLRAHSFIDPAYFKDNFPAVSLAIEKAQVYLAYEDEVLLGFIGLVDNYIAGIFIRSSHQARGLGSQLLDQAKLGSSRLKLNVYRDNPRALNFYMGQGFKVKNEYKDPATGAQSLGLVWTK